jgi:hypothetical protein
LILGAIGSDSRLWQCLSWPIIFSWKAENSNRTFVLRRFSPSLD